MQKGLSGKAAGEREKADGFPSLNRTPRDDRGFEPESPTPVGVFAGLREVGLRSI